MKQIVRQVGYLLRIWYILILLFRRLPEHPKMLYFHLN